MRKWLRFAGNGPPNAARASTRKAHYICVTSVHGVIMAEDDPQVRRILNEADIATPDGMPLVRALRSFGAREQQRVYWPTLTLELCRDAAVHGHRIFLGGGREDTLPMLRAHLTDEFPGYQICGSYSPTA
jgi:N-acetylglucosaminyldiphosphoundecaprenol N-acetyl-beta-D-mannosaminyltransferase